MTKRTMMLAWMLMVLGAAVHVSASAAQEMVRAEVSAQYQYVHTNAPPGGCGCFSLNGGLGSAAYYVRPALGVVLAIGAVTNPNAENSGHSITLFTFVAGPRYRRPLRGGRVVLFGQTLVGLSNESGYLAQIDANGQLTQTRFAATVGGGADLMLSPRLSLRLVQADYFVTTFKNAVNDHQNNTSVSTGVVFRFPGKP